MFSNKILVLCVVSVVELIEQVISVPAEISPELYPYHVYVNGHGTYWCSGTLISKDHILTDGFCVNGAKGVTIYLGFQSNPFYEANRQEPNTQTIEASEVTIHEDYLAIKQYRYFNNIALIKLSKSATLTNRIQPGLLASKAQARTIFGRTGTVTSWYQQYLSSVLVRVSNQDTCQVAFGPSYFSSQEICGKWIDGGLEATGSPLTVNKKIYAQRTSAPCPVDGITCGSFAVFVNYAHFLEWISAHANIPVETLTGEKDNIGDGDGNGACCLRVEGAQTEIIKRLEHLRVLAESTDGRQERIEVFLQRLLPQAPK